MSEQQSRPGWRRLLGLARYVRRAFGLVWDTDRRLSLALSALTVASGALPAGIAYLGKLIIDGVLRAVATAGPAQRRSVLLLVGLEFGLVVSLVALQRALAVSDALLRVRLAQRVVELVLNKALTLSLRDFETPALYDGLTRVREQATERPLSLVRRALLALQLSVTFAGFLLILTRFSGWLALVLLLAAVPALWVEARFNADAFRLFQARSPEARRQAYLETLLTREDHAKELKIFGVAGLLLRRHRQIFHDWYGKDRALTLRRGLWGFCLTLLTAGALAGSYAWVAWSAMVGVISVGTLAMLFTVLRQAQSVATELLLAIAGMYDDNLYISDLYRFLEYPTLPDGGHARSGPIVGDGLRFEAVEFSYPGATEPAISGLDLHLTPGTKLAVVGRNGAGKSTLVKLATGLYTPTRGRISLDGRDLTEWDRAALAQRFSVLFQDYVRYQLQVSDNIGFGDVDHLRDVARRARAAGRALVQERIESLPHAYETQLGHWFEGGHELSHGEWQKVALARAFMREGADILVLDEPSASLDTEAEAAIFSHLQSQRAAQSALLISHRPATLRFADEILVLDHGRCVERGRHQDLLANAGPYARLFSG